MTNMTLMSSTSTSSKTIPANTPLQTMLAKRSSQNSLPGSLTIVDDANFDKETNSHETGPKETNSQEENTHSETNSETVVITKEYTAIKLNNDKYIVRPKLPDKLLAPPSFNTHKRYNYVEVKTSTGTQGKFIGLRHILFETTELPTSVTLLSKSRILSILEALKEGEFDDGLLSDDLLETRSNEEEI